jgi:hypothetical protein
VRQIVRPLLVDGDTEGVDAVQARLKQGLAGVLDAVLAPIGWVVVVGLAVGQGDQELDAGVLAAQQLGQVTDGAPMRV